MITLSLLMLATSLGEVGAEDMQVRSRMLLAPRGGVLMARLSTELASSAWPDQVMLQLVEDSGNTVELVGHIAWMEIGTPPGRASWTADRMGLQIRPVEPEDRFDPQQMRNVVEGPRLLVALPDDASGALVLGESTLNLQWIDAPKSMPPIRVGGGSREGVLTAVPMLDRPDPDNPLDWWRWELLAERRGMEPPPPDFESIVARLAARHVTGLWRLAMTRLHDASRGVAARCRDLLTGTCMADGNSIAAWITEANRIDELLRSLLDFNLDDDARIEAALSWADSQISQFVWTNQSFGPVVQISIANPDPRKVLAEFIWMNGDDVPLGVSLAADDVTTNNLRRHAAAVARSGYRMDILNLVIENQVQRIPFGDAVALVKPPGPVLGPFKPALSLADVRAGNSSESAIENQSWIQIRRHDGKWELYVECLREPSAAGTTHDQKPLPEKIDSLDELLGIEAMAIQIGHSAPDQIWPTQCVVISPHDGWRRYTGNTPEIPEINVRVQEDRWLATMSLPDSWLPANGDELLLSATRLHAENNRFETIPSACPPWNPDPLPIYLDLSIWDKDEPTLRTAGSRR